MIPYIIYKLFIGLLYSRLPINDYRLTVFGLGEVAPTKVGVSSVAFIRRGGEVAKRPPKADKSGPLRIWSNIIRTYLKAYQPAEFISVVPKILKRESNRIIMGLVRIQKVECLGNLCILKPTKADQKR